MAYDKFLIAPFDENSGLTTNLRPWMIPDSAFATMDNMNVFRGRIRKRFGSRYMGVGPLNSRLRIQVGTIGSPSSPVPGAVFVPGQEFSAGSIVFTVVTTGTPGLMLNNAPGINEGNTNSSGNASGTASGSSWLIGQTFSIGNQLFTVTASSGALTTSGPGSGTFNTSTGAYTFTGAAANTAIFYYPVVGTYNTSTGAFVLYATGLGNSTPIYFYPAQPVMGLKQYEFSTINNFPSFGFDPQFAYIFAGGGWQLSTNSPIWHGSDANFFWGYNWVGPNAGATALTRALFVSNFYATNPNGVGTANDDPIYYYNNSTWTAYYAYLNPGSSNDPETGPFVLNSLMIFPFKGRLVLLNTIENDGGDDYGNNINYVNRARWTTLGSPFAVNAWYPVGAADNDGNIGINANFADASTLEAIVSAEFIKDRLIVAFEESTWELAYTGNENLPFEWQKLNTELGSMATYGTIAFDRAALFYGETSINSCNGSNVTRIDQKIPDEVFKTANPATETERICGIRDYFNEMVYWSIPNQTQRSVQYFPSQVLVYNYQNQTWSFNDDCITALGYFDNQPALTWSTLTGTWQEWTAPWNSGDSAQQVRQIIGGNQQGYTFTIDTESEFSTRNAGVLQITSMTQESNGIEMVIYNHMLVSGDYIYVENTNAAITLEGQMIYQVIYVDQNTIIATYSNEVIESTGGLLPVFSGVYTGGATAARVSNYNIYSKQWNPYDKDGRNVYVAKIDFAVIQTANGEVTVDYSPSSTPLSMLTDGAATGALQGTGVLETKRYPANLYPLEQYQNRLWHAIYLQTDGECIQINISMDDVQISNPAIAFSDFQIEGLVLHTKPVSFRLQ